MGSLLRYQAARLGSSVLERGLWGGVAKKWLPPSGSRALIAGKATRLTVFVVARVLTAPSQSREQEAAAVSMRAAFGAATMPPQSRAALRSLQGQDAGGTELLARAGTAAWGCGWREGPHSERCRLSGARGGRTAQDQRKPNNGIRWRIFKGSRTEGESVGNQFRLLLPAAAAARALQLEPRGWAIAWSGPTVHAAEEGSSGLPAPPGETVWVRILAPTPSQAQTGSSGPRLQSLKLKIKTKTKTSRLPPTPNGMWQTPGACLRVLGRS